MTTLELRHNRYRTVRGVGRGGAVGCTGFGAHIAEEQNPKRKALQLVDLSSQDTLHSLVGSPDHPDPLGSCPCHVLSRMLGNHVPLLWMLEARNRILKRREFRAKTT